MSLFSACKKQTTTAVGGVSIFDPTSPDVDNGGTNRIPSVYNLTAQLNTSNNKVTLQWLIPSNYTAQSFEIYVYRILGDGVTITLDDPSTPYSISSYFYTTEDFQPVTSSQYTDPTTLNSSTTYTYYVYIKSGDNWSAEKKITIVAGNTIPDTTTINANNFWSGYTQAFGIPMAPNQTTVSSATLSPGRASSSNPTGGCVFAEGGGLMYCADTDKNRVMIYQTNAYQLCSGLNDPSTLDIYQLCLSINRGYPFIAMAVLGQKDLYSSYPCGDVNQPLGMDSCFTKPSSVTIADGKLIVSDTGNNRIMVHSTLPTNGCFNILELNPGTTMVKQCKFSGVIGKKSLIDVSNYSLSLDGNSSLNKPTGITYKPSSTEPGEGDLYIADTGNNRVVVARKVLKSNYWRCDDTTWKTTLCSFNGLLGQVDYFSNKSFKEEYLLGNFTYDSINKDIRKKDGFGNFISDEGFFLSHYFANPNRILFNGNNLLISADEDLSDTNSAPNLFMRSRIIVYDINPLDGISPLCLAGSTFNSKCGYDRAIGQISPRQLVEVNSLVQEVGDVRYYLQDLDFALVGDSIFGIDRSLNRVYVWSDYKNAQVNSGTPYDFYVGNPLGSVDTVNNRLLPNLVNLNDVVYDANSGNLYVQDSQLGHIFEVPLTREE